MKLSLCITTYNRYELTLKSFEKVLNDSRITEIIIVDDCSTDDSYNKIRTAVIDCSKIRLYRNEFNVGMSLNKAKAIGLAENEYAIIFDSDNILSKTYLDALEQTILYPNTIYMPDFAMPNFDFREFAGLIFGKNTVTAFMNKPMFRVCLNTANYVVHRERYMEVYEHEAAIKATDTLNHNYNHLKAGGDFYVVPGMAYQHLVHPGSGFRADMDYNMRMAAEIENKIRQL